MRKKIIEEGKYYGTRKKITESRVSHRFLDKSKYMRVDTKKKSLGWLSIRVRNRSKERHAVQLPCISFSKPDFHCGVFTWISLI